MKEKTVCRKGVGTIRISLVCFLLAVALFQPEVFAQNWEELEDYPGLGRDDAVAFSIADCGYLVTGNHNGFWESNDMWKYSTTTAQWSKAAGFPGEKRQYALAFTHDEFAYVLGGISENNIPLNDFYRYSPLTDSWQQLDSFPGVARWSAASAVYEKSAYVFGGTTLTNTLNDSWRFDFISGSWENLPAVPSIGKRDQLCFSIGEKIYLSSGFSINPLVFHSESYSYNTLTHTWNSEADFPSEAIGYGTVANSGTDAIVLGGYRANGSFSDEAWQFDGGKWTELETCLSVGTRGMSAFTIDNKHYFLTGKKEDLSLSNDFYVLSLSREDDLLAYPNPTTENVHFNAPIGSSMEVFNLLGQSVTRHSFDFNNETFFKFSESGVYLVHVFFQDRYLETKKIVVL